MMMSLIRVQFLSVFVSFKTVSSAPRICSSFALMMMSARPGVSDCTCVRSLCLHMCFSVIHVQLLQQDNYCFKGSFV